MEITAEFETPDMAEFALSALRRNNIELHSYTIRAARPISRQQKPPAAEVTNLWLFSSLADTENETSGSHEEPSEVILTAVVPDDKADYARDLLRGSHGLHIK